MAAARAHEPHPSSLGFRVLTAVAEESRACRAGETPTHSTVRACVAGMPTPTRAILFQGLGFHAEISGVYYLRGVGVDNIRYGALLAQRLWLACWVALRAWGASASARAQLGAQLGRKGEVWRGRVRLPLPSRGLQG